jgi:glycosyltransferase involved in cell wall biosynthesis
MGANYLPSNDSGAEKGECLLNVVNIGTYPPKECGIALFSKDLRDNLVAYGHNVIIGALSDDHFSYLYPSEVKFDIRQNEATDYLRVAQQINISPDIDLVIIQHEYGIFGGPDGELILEFTTHLDKPYLVVTHTVLPEPSANQQRVLAKLTQHAAAVVCMTKGAARLLTAVYGTSPARIHIIHHGVPVFPFQQRVELKIRYDCQDRRVINTFGLIGPGKGLELGIRAVDLLRDKHPDILYLIAGKTHPVLFRRDGESYRKTLIQLVRDLHLEEHVQFINRFLSVEELGSYLYLSDIYLSPYPHLDQAVSGTLAYAIGCGRAIVATPYEYALGLLQSNRYGLITTDATPAAIAEQLNRVLSNPDLQSKMEIKAADFGKTLRWPYVAAEYLKVAGQILRTSAPRQRLVADVLSPELSREGRWPKPPATVSGKITAST